VIALPPRADSPTFLADWVELELLFGERRYLSQADLLDLLDDDPGSDRIDEEIARLEALYGEEINDEFVAEQRGRAREQEEEGLGRNEQLVEAVWLELSFRQQVVGATYPVAFEDGLLVITGSWGESVIYAFLAMLSARVTYSLSLPTGPPARRFEEVVSIALKTYTGGQSVRFGWPHDRNEFPSDFRTAARQLAHQLGERPGGMEAIGTNAKDYALDVVAWRGFDDGRRGQHVLLCQCATGKDWNEKMLSGRAWEKVIDFAVAPTCSVAFPFVPPRDDEEIAAWLDVAIKGGVPFDRLRLASLTRDDYADAELLGNLRTWVGEAQQALPRDD
jgi:hypothetical protein